MNTHTRLSTLYSDGGSSHSSTRGGCFNSSHLERRGRPRLGDVLLGSRSFLLLAALRLESLTHWGAEILTVTVLFLRYPTDKPYVTYASALVLAHSLSFRLNHARFDRPFLIVAVVAC